MSLPKKSQTEQEGVQLGDKSDITPAISQRGQLTASHIGETNGDQTQIFASCSNVLNIFNRKKVL